MEAVTKGSAQPPTYSTSSYAQIAKNDSFPTKNQAIIVDAINDIPLNDYITAIGKIIDPSNIRFASKISNNRVCVYIANQKIADDPIDSIRTIKVSNSVLSIRPLISRNKRIVISNVPPSIPHSILTDALSKFNVKPMSSIIFLRAGINEPGFSHILSFRRQMYIAPEDIEKIPDAIHINFEDTNYWIYLSGDSPVCFICKQDGHVASQCNTNIDNNTNSRSKTKNKVSYADINIQEQTTLEPLPTQRPTTLITLSNCSQPPIHKSTVITTMNTEPTNNLLIIKDILPSKRQHSDIASFTLEQSSTITHNKEVTSKTTKSKKIVKKQKATTPNYETELLPIKKKSIQIHPNTLSILLN